MVKIGELVKLGNLLGLRMKSDPAAAIGGSRRSISRSIRSETAEEEPPVMERVTSLNVMQTLLKAIHKMKVPGESRTSFSYEPDRRLSMAEKNRKPNTYQ